MPTIEQNNKISELFAQGYVWDKELSASTAGVVLVKGDSQWFFGLGGEIIENPHL